MKIESKKSFQGVLSFSTGVALAFWVLGLSCLPLQAQAWKVEDILEDADSMLVQRTVITEGTNFIRIPRNSADFVGAPGKVSYRLTNPLSGSLVIEPVASTHANAEVASEALYKQASSILPSGASDIAPGTAPVISAVWQGWWIGAAEWRFTVAGQRLYMAAFILQRNPGQQQVMGRIVVPEDQAEAGLSYVSELMPRWTESKNKPVIPIELMQ